MPAKRLGGGYYTLGSKKIYCKILNSRLVVRVGGGYMQIEDFLDQYGQVEADKYSMQQDVMDGIMHGKGSHQDSSEDYPPVVIVSTKQSIDSLVSFGGQSKNSKSSLGEIKASPRSQMARSVLEGANQPYQPQS